MLTRQQRPVPDSTRLFLALVPGGDVKAAIALHGDQWHWPESAARYAPADWHVTLHFIGSVAAARLTELRAGLTVPVTPFDLHFGQPELWPHGVAVLCPARVPEGLQQLQAHLGQALQRLGLQMDPRPFRPHITLARRAQATVPPLKPPSFVWHVAGYALMESTGHTPQRYRVMQQYGAAPRATSRAL